MSTDTVTLEQLAKDIRAATLLEVADMLKKRRALWPLRERLDDFGQGSYDESCKIEKILRDAVEGFLCPYGNGGRKHGSA